MRRHVVGILAIAFLAAAGVLLASPLFLAEPLVEGDLWSGMTLRLGIVLGALWLAWPQLARLPAWLALVVLGVTAAAVFLARQKMTLLVVAAALLVAALIRPRPRHETRQEPRR
jgi:hypothetical protein